MPETITAIRYTTFTGRFLAAVRDASDVDGYPEGVPLSGTVTFIPQVTGLLVPNAQPPTTVIPAPIIADLDEDGYLGVRNSDGSFTRSVKVIASDSPDVNPTRWTYRVAFAFTIAGGKVTYDAFDVAAPYDTAVDLTQVSGIQTSTGDIVVPGAPGVGVVSAASDGNGNLILTLSNGASLAPVPLPPGPVGAGVPAGGTALQLIRKNAANTTTEWVTPDKAMVGLGNVDNTADTAKPVSTAQQTALDGKIGTTQKGAANGVATLDAASRLPAAQLPVMDYGWMFANFTANGQNGEKLSIFYSPDGKAVYGGGGNPVYTDPHTGNSLRDPNITKIGNRYVEAHTVNNGLSKNFAVIAGTSLASMSEIALIDCSALADIKQIWAPEIVIDPAAPTRPYIFFSKINAAGTNGSMYWVQATNDTLTAWTAPTHMSWASEPVHYIDGSFIKVGSTWYCFYSTGADICRATATTLTGTYTTDRSGNWAGWGTGIEGPEIVRDQLTGTYRIYIDRFQSGQGYAWSESTDLNTWTTLTGLDVAPGTLPPGGLIRHGSFYQITDQPTYDMVRALTTQGRIDPRIVFTGSYTQGATGAVTPVGSPSQTVASSNNDLMVTANGNGLFTLLEAGDYEIYATFTVTAGSGVTRSFAELATAGGTTLARTPGAAEDAFQLVIPTYKAAAGEQLLIRTFLAFTGGGNATISDTIRFVRRSR